MLKCLATKTHFRACKDKYYFSHYQTITLFLNGKLKTENGPLRLSREQRVLAHFAEPQGEKACKAGLTKNLKRTLTCPYYPLLAPNFVAP